MSKNEKKRRWPEKCLWPEPLWDGEGEFWDWDLVEGMELDEEAEDLLNIKYYMDDLVAQGRLNEDYSINEDFACEDDAPFLSNDYWDDGFDFEGWQYDLSHHINMIKIDIVSDKEDPVSTIREIIGYSFVNENLLRQAFTRRAFATEYGLSGSGEELEFYGDSILNNIVTREIFKRFSKPFTFSVDAPYRSLFDEGSLSKIRSKFVSRDYLAARAIQLGLDKYILYGNNEEACDSAREDMIEALIGAVAVDTNWDWRVLEDVIDKLLALQLDNPEELIKKTYYEQLNTWHQKNFGCMPEYDVNRELRHKREERYSCVLRYYVPENNKGIRTSQISITEDMATRSSAREIAAEFAVRFLQGNGLWIRLEDAGIIPDLENSINQLQELYQKKYVSKPTYSFNECTPKLWECICLCNDFEGSGVANGKVKAKKKAAFIVLVKLMKSAGLATKEMELNLFVSEDDGGLI